MVKDLEEEVLDVVKFQCLRLYIRPKIVKEFTGVFPLHFEVTILISEGPTASL